MSALPISYDMMSRRVSASQDIAEVKDIHDKAAGWEKFLSQAKNFEDEKRAACVRLRAERKIGEMLRGSVRRGNRSKVERSNRSTFQLPDGISKDESSAWQAISYIPELKFEEYLADPTKGVLPPSQRAESGMPTTKGLVNLARAYKPKRAERLERKKTPKQLALFEEKRKQKEAAHREKVIRSAYARTQHVSDRMVGRAFALFSMLTPKEREKFTVVCTERSGELIP